MEGVEISLENEDHAKELQDWYNSIDWSAQVHAQCLAAHQDSDEEDSSDSYSEYTLDSDSETSSSDSSEGDRTSTTCSEYSDGYALFGDPDEDSILSDDTLESLAKHIDVDRLITPELRRSTQPRQILWGQARGILYPPKYHKTPRGNVIIKIDGRDSAAGLLISAKRWAVVCNIGQNTPLLSWIGIFSNPPPQPPIPNKLADFFSKYDRRYPGRYLAVLGDPPFDCKKFAAGDWDGEVGHASIRVWTLRSYLEGRGISHTKFDHRYPDNVNGRARIRIPANVAPLDARHNSLSDIIPGGTIAEVGGLDWNIYWSCLGPGILLHSSAFIHDYTHRARWPERANTSSESFKVLIQRYHDMLSYKKLWFPPRWAPDGPYRRWFKYRQCALDGTPDSSDSDAPQLDAGLIAPEAWKLLEEVEGQETSPSDSPTTGASADESMEVGRDTTGEPTGDDTLKCSEVLDADPTEDTPVIAVEPDNIIIPVEPSDVIPGKPEEDKQRGEKSKYSPEFQDSFQRLFNDSDDEVEVIGEMQSLVGTNAPGIRDPTNIQSMGADEPVILSRRSPANTHGADLEFSGRFEWHKPVKRPLAPGNAGQLPDLVRSRDSPDLVGRALMAAADQLAAPAIWRPPVFPRSSSMGAGGTAIYRMGAEKNPHNTGLPTRPRPTASSLAIDSLVERHRRSGNCPKCSHYARVPPADPQTGPRDPSPGPSGGVGHTMGAANERQTAGKIRRPRYRVSLHHGLSEGDGLQAGGRAVQERPLDLSMGKARDNSVTDTRAGRRSSSPSRDRIICFSDAAGPVRSFVADECHPEETVNTISGDQGKPETEPGAEGDKEPPSTAGPSVTPDPPEGPEA